MFLPAMVWAGFTALIFNWVELKFTTSQGRVLTAMPLRSTDNYYYIVLTGVAKAHVRKNKCSQN